MIQTASPQRSGFGFFFPWQKWLNQGYYQIMDLEELWFYRHPIENWNHYNTETKGYRFSVMTNTVGLVSRAYS